MKQIHLIHDETDIDAANQTDALINPLKQYYAYSDDKKEFGFVRQPAFSNFRNN